MGTCILAPLYFCVSPSRVVGRFVRISPCRPSLQATITERCGDNFHIRRVQVGRSDRSAAARANLSVDNSYDWYNNGGMLAGGSSAHEGDGAVDLTVHGCRASLKLRHVSPEEVNAVIAQVEHKIVHSMHRNRRKKLGEFAAANIELLLSLGMAEPQVVQTLGWNPAILGYNTSTKIWPFLDLLLDFDLDQRDLVRCLSGRWMVFSRDVDQVSSVLDYLRTELGVVKMGKVVGACPGLLGYSLETLKQTGRSLESLGIRNVGALVERDPQVLTCSLKKVRENVEFFCKLMGRDTVVDIIMRTPKVLWADRETMKISADKYILRWGKERAFQLFEKYPNALTGVWGPKEEKLDYVEKVMGRSFEDILNCPSVMTYNLENRIKVRYEMLKQVGRENISLGSFLCIKQSMFESRYMIQA